VQEWGLDIRVDDDINLYFQTMKGLLQDDPLYARIGHGMFMCNYLILTLAQIDHG
jgi:hypothetical protein